MGLVLLLRHMVKDCSPLKKYPTALHPGAHGKQLQRTHHGLYTHSKKLHDPLMSYFKYHFSEKSCWIHKKKLFPLNYCHKYFLTRSFLFYSNPQKFPPKIPKAIIALAEEFVEVT